MSEYNRKREKGSKNDNFKNHYSAKTQSKRFDVKSVSEQSGKRNTSEKVDQSEKSEPIKYAAKPAKSGQSRHTGRSASMSTNHRSSERNRLNTNYKSSDKRAGEQNKYSDGNSKAEHRTESYRGSENNRRTEYTRGSENSRGSDSRRDENTRGSENNRRPEYKSSSDSRRDENTRGYESNRRPEFKRSSDSRREENTRGTENNRRPEYTRGSENTRGTDNSRRPEYNKRSDSKTGEYSRGSENNKRPEYKSSTDSRREENTRGSESNRRPEYKRGTDSRRDENTRGTENSRRTEYKRGSEDSRRVENTRGLESNRKPEYKRGSDSRREENTRGTENNRNYANDRKTDKVSKSELNDNSYHNKRVVSNDACPHLRECGGCNILKQNYDAELKEKQKTVEKLLKNLCKVETIIGMKQPDHYRNKVHVVFDHDRKGNPISGVYEQGSHRVVSIENCQIHNQKADAIIASIRGMLKSFKIKTFDEDTGYGLIRHVLIRTGFSSGEIMVVLVLSSPILPSKNNFTKALLKEHPEITTIVINVNDKKTSMVLGDKETVIYGKGYIEDSLCGKLFRISPKSFYQVNPAQTEILYGKAIEMAELTGTETVIDAYCGIGTIGIIAADHVKKVIGVEMNKDAVKDANINAKCNETTNIEFYKNDAGDFMTQMAAQKEIVDVVFMDPPRTGSNEKFMDALGALKPQKIVYVSCNPITLERDLTYITKKGYKILKAVPVDMFPWTQHVECIILMTYCGDKRK